MASAKSRTDDQAITVRIPISIRRHGGWKLVLAPDGKTEMRFSRLLHVVVRMDRRTVLVGSLPIRSLRTY
jgi:hypothetical protein